MSGDSGVVNVVNKRGSALFVGFSGSISWDERCITHSGTAVILAAGAHRCGVEAGPSAGVWVAAPPTISRFS